MGPRKQAKDSRKVCERGVPGNFYLARHSFIRVVLFLDLEMVFFRRLKLNMAAHSLNWNPCFLLDSSCIQHILGEKKSCHRVKGNSFLCEQCFASSCPAFECVTEKVFPFGRSEMVGRVSRVAA